MKKIVSIHSQMTGFLINDKQNAFYARSVYVFQWYEITQGRVPSHALHVYVNVLVCMCSVNSIIIVNYFQLIFLHVAESEGKRVWECK